VTPTVCPNCSCLCDDVELEVGSGNTVERITNACIKGASFIRSVLDPSRRAPCLVEGRPVSVEEAMDRALALISGARRPLIFGLDNSTAEAQGAGIKLARALGAVLDDTSSFCQGTVTEALLKGELPGCELPQAEQADLIIYWGSNPYHAHPRHLSRYTYYVREEYREAGWMPDVTLVCIEVRDTETTVVCHPTFKLPPGGDGRFIRSTLEALEGREADGPSREFAALLQEARFIVLFTGLGLVYSLKNDLSPLKALVERLQREGKRVGVIPMVGHFNSRGFNHVLFGETGFVNRVSFADGVASGPEYSVLEQLRRGLPDLAIIIGSNPFVNLPYSAVRHLEAIPVISFDPLPTETVKRSRVNFGVAVSGLEIGGRACRMDGVEVALKPCLPAPAPGDEEILSRILERLG